MAAWECLGLFREGGIEGFVQGPWSKERGIVCEILGDLA